MSSFAGLRARPETRPPLMTPVRAPTPLPGTVSPWAGLRERGPKEAPAARSACTCGAAADGACHDGESLDLMLQHQYRMLEQAIAEQASRHSRVVAASAEPALAPLLEQLESPGASAAGLNFADHRLVDEGWTLVLPGAGLRMPLNSEERLLMMSLALTRGHRLGRGAMQAIFAAYQLADDVAAIDQVVRSLRGRARIAGGHLPLRAVGGGYQFGGVGTRPPGRPPGSGRWLRSAAASL